MNNIHQGHRQRLRDKFLAGTVMSDHELIELLLHYALPQKNTNEIAHMLLEKCGGFDGVFTSDMSLLCTCEGLGEISATLLKLIPIIMQRFEESLLKRNGRINYKNIKEFFIPKFYGETAEKLLCCTLNDDLDVTACGIISNGSLNLAPIAVSNIVKFAYNYNSNLIVLAHNHPSGNAEPSEKDISSTRFLANTLRPVNIMLIDHIVVAGQEATSLKYSGKMFYMQ